MSSVATTAQSPVVVAPTPERQIPWLNLAWFSALLIACYLPMLEHLVWQWYNDEDMGHGFFVPVVAAYIAWQSRDKLLNGRLKRSYWGIALMAFAAVQY